MAYGEGKMEGKSDGMETYMKIWHWRCVEFHGGMSMDSWEEDGGFTHGAWEEEGGSAMKIFPWPKCLVSPPLILIFTKVHSPT